MALGIYRHSKGEERGIMDRLRRHKARMDELVRMGWDEDEASKQAFEEICYNAPKWEPEVKR